MYIRPAEQGRINNYLQKIISSILTYLSRGKCNKAEQLEVQVLVMSKKVLGAEHPGTLTSMTNLARIYSNMGKLKEEKQLEVQVLDMSKKVLGIEHPGTLLE